MASWATDPYPTPCIDCGAGQGEPCSQDCPNVQHYDPELLQEMADDLLEFARSLGEGR